MIRANLFSRSKYVLGGSNTQRITQVGREIVLMQELKALGVNKEDIKLIYHPQYSNHIQVKFMWQYPHTEAPREYRVTLIDVDVRRLRMRMTTPKVLNDILDRGIDIFYYRAGVDQSKFYRFFIPRITKAVRVGGYNITDDHGLCYGKHMECYTLF